MSKRSTRFVATLVTAGLAAGCGGTSVAVKPSESGSSTPATTVARSSGDFEASLPPGTTSGSAPPVDATTTPATTLAAGTTTVALTYDLPGCPDSERGAVADKAEQRYWLCANGVAVSDRIPMTTASEHYGLPPIGTYRVFARDDSAFGINGEPLERFVAFYTTSKGNRIAFHEVVNQDPDTVGDLDRRGESAGCFRVREEDSIDVWEFLRLDDPVVVIS